MDKYSIKDLKKSNRFVQRILWGVTPKKFMQPRSHAPSGTAERQEADAEGYILYVDLVYNRPTLVIMTNRRTMSKTVGYVEGVPEDLLREAAHCSPDECVAGMYPLTKELEEWLKKELGVTR